MKIFLGDQFIQKKIVHHRQNFWNHLEERRSTFLVSSQRSNIIEKGRPGIPNYQNSRGRAPNTDYTPGVQKRKIHNTVSTRIPRNITEFTGDVVKDIFLLLQANTLLHYTKTIATKNEV